MAKALWHVLVEWAKSQGIYTRLEAFTRGYVVDDDNEVDLDYLAAEFVKAYPGYDEKKVLEFLEKAKVPFFLARQIRDRDDLLGVYQPVTSKHGRKYAVPAKKTWYAGEEFRSRTEARWAVFFGEMGLDWDYEPEPQVHPGYLPDFLLGPGHLWAEVKPGPPNDNEVRVMQELIEGSGYPGMFLFGDMLNWGGGILHYPVQGAVARYQPVFFMARGQDPAFEVTVKHVRMEGFREDHPAVTRAFDKAVHYQFEE